MINPFASILAESKNVRALPSRHVRQSRPCFEFAIGADWRFSRRTTPTLPSAPDFRDVAFEIDLDRLAKQSLRLLGRLEADFAWTAMAVYLADRFAPRYPYGPNGTAYWRRRIHVIVPVAALTAWARADEFLRQALNFLTEDDWSFEFRANRPRWTSEEQAHLPDFPPTSTTWAALFSGGLDSLAGALQRLQQFPGTGLLVSGQTNSRIAVGQREQVKTLRSMFPGQVEQMGIGYGIADKDAIAGRESSQRTRAFIHIALGSLAALRAGASSLQLFENGFGALNLACDTAQIGSQSSRGTHPVFLQRMGAVVTALFGRPFSIENPCFSSTKAQMIVGVDTSKLGRLLERSFSCERYPNYPHKAPQCGRCASCLIRRMSMHASGQTDDGANYTFDIFSPRRVGPLRESELLAQTKLSVQAQELQQQLNAANAWSAVTAKWPDLLRTEWELQRPGFRADVLGLLRRHVAEWRAFAAATGRVQLRDAA